MPGKATFTAPPLGASDQNPNVCGLRVVVTDAAGGSTTRNWSYGLKANAGPPVPVINTLPAKVLASTPATPGVVALSGAATTDPDTNPAQPLAYTWEQIDPTTGDPVAANSPAKGVFSTRLAQHHVDRGHDGAALGAVPPDGHRRDLVPRLDDLADGERHDAPAGCRRRSGPALDAGPDA